MRLVIQRVTECKLKVNNELVSKIGKGLFVLVGVGITDTEKEAGHLAEKLSKLRVMADKEGKMNLSVKDVDSELLVVSQFTLYGDTTGGNRPSFIKAARPELAEQVYKHFIEKLKVYGISVKTGSFGEYMRIEPILDGPVTILMESGRD